jgi:oligoribonuclease NrnB/cAMP/cGMP phosphodiesterase (DHH superfamily)
MEPVVIYHANCDDGFAAAWCANRAMKGGCVMIAANYGDVSLDEERECLKFKNKEQWSVAVKGRAIYVLDFSVSRDVTDKLIEHAGQFVWLDHHKTALAMWTGDDEASTAFMTIGEGLEGKIGRGTIQLDNSQSGAMLAWKYFFPGERPPALIRHVQDHDLWKFEDPGTRRFLACLRSHPRSLETFDEFANYDMGQQELSFSQTAGYSLTMKEGAAILRAWEKNVKSVVDQYAAKIAIRHGINGETFVGLGCNAPTMMASDAGNLMATRCGTFGMTWSVAKGGKEAWVQLRCNDGYNVRRIAQLFGGGGHDKAAGFTIDANTLMGWMQ